MRADSFESFIKNLIFFFFFFAICSLLVFAEFGLVGFFGQVGCGHGPMRFQVNKI